MRTRNRTIAPRWLLTARAHRTRSLNETWYNGYREQNMLGVFIALWCAVSYFAKVTVPLAHCGVCTRA